MNNFDKSCFKCGKIGHLASECTDLQVLTEINEFEEKIKNEVNSIYTEALQNPNYPKDEFGPFHPDSPQEKNTDQNWSNTTYCYNCGRPGHSNDKCPHPLFENFYKTIQNSFENNDTDDGSKIKQEFDSIWNSKQ